MFDRVMWGEHVWLVVAAVFMVIAAFALLWLGSVEVAFVTATIGIVAWFLNLRNRLKKTIPATVDEDDEEDSVERDENQ